MKYRLTCTKCDLNYTHEAFSMDSAKDFWEKWNREHEKEMKCVHEYRFEGSG